MTPLRALECLVTVVEQGSLTKAAAVLHMSQPALSHQIAAVERELGARGPAWTSVRARPRGGDGGRRVPGCRLDRFPQGRAQPAQGPDVREVSARYTRVLDPPPRLRVAIRRQEIFRRRRSRRRDGIDEIHGDNRLADHGEVPASGSANGHIQSIGIRNFDKCHEFFETIALLPQA